MNNNIVEIKNLIKKYRNKTVLNVIDLVINENDKIGIVGPNGTGKTTLCEIIANLRKPTSGYIVVDPRIKIGMQTQEAKYPKGFTGEDLILYYLDTYNSKKSVLEIKELLYYLDCENIINQPITNLSGGQQQKINILLALIADPNLIILDELATGLDLEARSKIYHFLNEKIFTKKPLACIIISHNMKEIEMFCDQVIFMLNGKIISRNDVHKIVKEHGSVENFVTNQFKEYKVGFYNEQQLNQNLSAQEESLFLKKWERKLSKKMRKK